MRQGKFSNEISVCLTCRAFESTLRGNAASRNMLTSQLPPPTVFAEDEGPLCPKVNMLNSPLEITTNTSIHVRDFARRFEVSQNCLRHNIPSFAHGAPNRASSSSDMLTEVETVSTLLILRASSSWASLMIVWERFDAKPSVGACSAELEAARV